MKHDTHCVVKLAKGALSRHVALRRHHTRAAQVTDVGGPLLPFVRHAADDRSQPIHAVRSVLPFSDDFFLLHERLVAISKQPNGHYVETVGNAPSSPPSGFSHVKIED